MKKKLPSSHGIPLKKHHGQYFLRDKQVIVNMLSNIDLKGQPVFEIGCGDGFLTREILAQEPSLFWVFEIDPAWGQQVGQECAGDTFKMHVQDFLEVDLEALKPQAPWKMLSNLPYHVTFPILHRLHQYRHFISEGVVMMQEEVAQKIVKDHGRGYGYVSLFFQYYFDWKMLAKVLPTSFYPEPKVFSRLLKFTTKQNVAPITEEKEFWKFIRLCFAHPRRTLRNNLAQTHIPLDKVPGGLLDLRAQQMSMTDFLTLWETVMPLFMKAVN